MRKVNMENEKIRQENLRLQLQTQEVTDLENELNGIIEHRDGIERSIRNVTAEPFLKKDSGQTIAMKIVDLKEKLREKEKLCRTLKEQERGTKTRFDAQKAELEKLTGAKNTKEGEHQEIRKNFQS